MNGDRPHNDLEARHLRVLVALAEQAAEQGTFTDAAIALGVSQSAVSRALTQLEAIIGIRLVNRTTRSLALTAAGEDAARVAAEALAAIGAVSAAAHGARRPLRLGYAWSAFGRFTSDILSSWRHDHPEFPVEIHRIDDRTAGLRTGQVDLAVVRGAVPGADKPGNDLIVRPLFHEPRMAAVPATSPLAARVTVTLEDLAEHTVVLTRSTGTTTADLWPADRRPREVIDVTNLDEWLTEIAAGAAVGVTPESTRYQHPHPGVSYRDLPGVPGVDVSLVWRAGREHPATAAFVALAQARVRTAGEIDGR